APQDAVPARSNAPQWTSPAPLSGHIVPHLFTGGAPRAYAHGNVPRHVGGPRLHYSRRVAGGYLDRVGDWRVPYVQAQRDCTLPTFGRDDGFGHRDLHGQNRDADEGGDDGAARAYQEPRD